MFHTNPLVSSILATGISLVLLFALFRPLELAFPARPAQRLFRPQFLTDLCYLLGQYLLFNGAVFWVLTHAEPYLRHLAPESVRATVGGWPLWVQAPLVILLSDVLIYWGHRLQHNNAFLWRFHSIHHSAEHLDWLAAHREHPIDSIYTIGLINLPIFALGFPVQALAVFAAFRGIWAIFIHSNVRLPIGPLRVLIGAPELHHWHHDRDRDAGNYANVSPLMDVLFGTYRCPGHEPEAFGIKEPISQNYLGQMLHPFRRKRDEAAGAQPATEGQAEPVMQEHCASETAP